MSRQEPFKGPIHRYKALNPPDTGISLPRVLPVVFAEILN